MLTTISQGLLSRISGGTGRVQQHDWQDKIVAWKLRKQPSPDYLAWQPSRAPFSLPQLRNNGATASLHRMQDSTHVDSFLKKQDFMLSCLCSRISFDELTCLNSKDAYI